MKPVEVFKAEDFRNSEGYLLTSDKCAEAANKLLSERMVKYYSMRDGETTTWFASMDHYPEGDTHIIYGLTPQPIIKESVNSEPQLSEADRKVLADLADIARPLEAIAKKMGWIP